MSPHAEDRLSSSQHSIEFREAENSRKCFFFFLTDSEKRNEVLVLAGHDRNIMLR